MSKKYGASDLNTRFKKVFVGDEDTGFSIVPSETEGMWRVSYPDGVLSKDHYNKTRAREHSITEAALHLRIGAEPGKEPSDELL